MDDQQREFVHDFEVLFTAAHMMKNPDVKSHLEALWARYHALLSLTEIFAGRADAAAEEMTRIVRSEVDSKIKR